MATKRELAGRAELFREGARRAYEGDRPLVKNDMWLFELFHFLGDVQEKLGEYPRSEIEPTGKPVIV
jgi:hypothetical protein